MGGVWARMSIPLSHVARTVSQLHDRLRLRYRETAKIVTTERQVAGSGRMDGKFT